MDKTPPPGDPGDLGQVCGQYLAFLLAGEAYGVDILRVQEIRGWEPVTRVPNQPSYVRGVSNLRGAIVPVFDLRLRFGLPLQPDCPDRVLVVLRVLGGDQVTRCMGLVVDAVTDVLETRELDIRAAPEHSGFSAGDCIIGLAGTATKMVMLLDVDRLLGDEDLSLDQDLFD